MKLIQTTVECTLRTTEIIDLLLRLCSLLFLPPASTYSWKSNPVSDRPMNNEPMPDGRIRAKALLPPEITVIYDTDETDWTDWSTNTGKYNGWRIQTHPLLQRKVYGVCQINREQNNNLLFSPLIKLPITALLEISVVYTMRSCREHPETETTRNCQEKLELLIGSGDRFDADLKKRLQSYKPLANLLRHGRLESVIQDTFTSSSSDEEHVQVHTEIIEQPAQTNIALAVKDQGACSTLRRIQLSYKSCPKLRYGLLTFQRTVPQHRNQSVDVRGVCAHGSGSMEFQILPQLRCSHLGQWMIGHVNNGQEDSIITSYDTFCQCLPGYGTTSDTFNQVVSCRACTNKEYKVQFGTFPCVPCPANSVRRNKERQSGQKDTTLLYSDFHIQHPVNSAVREREGISDVCQCNDGFFRHPLLDTIDSPCTRLPTKPLDLKVDSSDAARLELRWKRPFHTGGRSKLWYTIKCTDTEGQPCDREPTLVLPESVFDTSAKLVGMALGKTYNFRITARNELSELFSETDLVNSSATATSSLPDPINIQVHNLCVQTGPYIPTAEFNSRGKLHAPNNASRRPTLEAVKVSWDPPSVHEITSVSANATAATSHRALEYQVYVWLVQNGEELTENRSTKPILTHFLSETSVHLTDLPGNLSVVAWVRPKIALGWGRFAKATMNYSKKSTDHSPLPPTNHIPDPVKEHSSRVSLSSLQQTTSDPQIKKATIIWCSFIVCLLCVCLALLIVAYRMRAKIRDSACFRSLKIPPNRRFHMLKQMEIPKFKEPDRIEVSKVTRPSAAEIMADLQTIENNVDAQCTEVEKAETEIVVPRHEGCETVVPSCTNLLTFRKEVDSERVKISSTIGKGEFGEVCAGFFDCQRIVAVKMLRDDVPEKTHRDFLQEAIIMEQLSHPNVITLIGVVTKSSPMMIITEYMENGALDKYLQKIGATFSNIGRLKMLMDICKGMEYIAHAGFVHRDLAARNVLVNKLRVCKISDFGLARRIGQDQKEDAYTLTDGKVPVRWTAPEAVLHRRFTTASDIWSFGIVAWEVFSNGQRPYWDWTNQAVITMLEQGYRLPAPDHCPNLVYQLMLICWSTDACRRPQFSAVHNQLASFIDERTSDNLFVDQVSLIEDDLFHNASISKQCGLPLNGTVTFRPTDKIYYAADTDRLR